MSYFCWDMTLNIKTKIEAEKRIKVSPFRKEIRKTTPHKRNSYFEIIYLTAGKGYHRIDSKKYIVCVRKENVPFIQSDIPQLRLSPIRYNKQ